MNKIAKTPTDKSVTASRKIRTSVFLDRASLDQAAEVAKMQSRADPLREDVSVASVLRVSISIGLENLKRKHLAAKSASGK